MKFDLAKAIAETESEQPSLERAIAMGELMVQADAIVQQLTAKLADAKKRYNDIATNALPQLLKELGLSYIGLKDGTKIEVKEDLSCSITEANNTLALKWLMDHDFGGIIKTNVTVSFPATEQEQAAAFAAEVAQEYDGVIYKATVHPATLKSFVKEQLAAGTALPLDLFSVHEYSIAKLTQPRSK